MPKNHTPKGTKPLTTYFNSVPPGKGNNLITSFFGRSDALDDREGGASENTAPTTGQSSRASSPESTTPRPKKRPKLDYVPPESSPHATRARTRITLANTLNPPANEAGIPVPKKSSPATTPLRNVNLAADSLLLSDDDDADLIAPSALYAALASEAVKQIPPEPTRRSARAKKSINYSAPPLDVFHDRELFQRAEQQEKLQKLLAPPKRKTFNIDALLADKRKQERRARESEALEVLMQQEEQEGNSILADFDELPDSIVPEEAVDTVKDMMNQNSAPSSRPMIISILRPSDDRELDPPALGQDSVLPSAFLAVIKDRNRFVPLLRTSVFERLISKSSKAAKGILLWMSGIACFDQDKHVSAAAMSNLAHVLTNTSNPWHYTIPEFVEALEILGYPSARLKMDDSGAQLPEFLEESPPKDAGKTLDYDTKSKHQLASKRIITLMGMSVKHRSASYTSAELLDLAWILSVVSLDHDIQRVAANVVGDALAIVVETLAALPNWPASRAGLCAALAAFAGENNSLSADAVVSSDADGGMMLKPIMDALDKAPPFAPAYYGAPRSPAEYVALGDSVRILALAIGLAEAARKEPAAAKQIASRLRHIFGNIADPRAAYPERTEAKHELITLSTWLRFVTADMAQPGAQSRLTFLKGQVIAEPKRAEAAVANTRASAVTPLVTDEAQADETPSVETAAQAETKVEEAQVKTENS
ncbi:hypothetical protein HDU89_008074 [Geranomyces variabilis]|nr:hypothetical protein HDU89_008074 [Geranomyces variabilis]